MCVSKKQRRCLPKLARNAPAVRIDQALGMIDRGALDAAVLDVNLIGQHSYPVADALVASGVPFVFSTGYDKDKLLEGYRSFPVLQKPYQESDLAGMLTQLLGPKELIDELGTR